MNLEDPRIKAAFARGYMNKRAEYDLEKGAFLLPLLGTLYGGLRGATLAGKYLAPAIGSWAERALAKRLAARAIVPGELGTIPKPPGWATNKIDSVLRSLSTKVNPAELAGHQYYYPVAPAGELASQLGQLGGSVLGGGIGAGVEGLLTPQQTQQPSINQ